MNFVTKTLTVEIGEASRTRELNAAATDTIQMIEAHVKVRENQVEKILKREFLLEGLGCANCAAKMEKEANSIEGVKAAARSEG